MQLRKARHLRPSSLTTLLFRKALIYETNQPILSTHFISFSSHLICSVQVWQNDCLSRYPYQSRHHRYMALGHDGALRTCLVWLAIIMVIIWLHTESLKKVTVTYVVGVAGIAGILLPDWDFFDRDIHRWSSPLTSDERAALFALRHKSLFKKSSFVSLPLSLSSFLMCMLSNCLLFSKKVKDCKVVYVDAGIGYTQCEQLHTLPSMDSHCTGGGCSYQVRRWIPLILEIKLASWCEIEEVFSLFISFFTLFSELLDFFSFFFGNSLCLRPGLCSALQLV